MEKSPIQGKRKRKTGGVIKSELKEGEKCNEKIATLNDRNNG